MITDQLKLLVGRMSRRLGYEIVPSARIMPRDIAGHLGRLFALLDICCVLDVGANVGQFHDMLRHDVKYDGLIVSFEPARKAARALRDRARSDDRWIVHDVALGAANEMRAFNVMRSDLLSSFLEPDEAAVKPFAPFNVVNHTEHVRVRTLDSVMAELRKERELSGGVFLKMDTQGYDLEVIKGARDCLARIAAIQTEFACQRMYKDMPHYIEVLRTLDARGFQISGIFPVSEDTLLRVIECDAVLVNSAHLAPGEDVRLMWTNAV